jgi:serine/threonine protein kinase/tetratricopeptide (TPR) repeat protein
MTDASRYERAKDIFLAASEQPDEEREAFVERECGGDETLLEEVRSLLEHHDEGDPEAETSLLPPGPRPIPRAAPEVIGPYRVLHEIGAGGMGIVYLGVRDDDKFKRRVAIKLLKRGMDTEEVLRRFELERQLLAAMNHPGIARLYDAGETADGRPYIAMEYIEGQPLDEYCDQNRLDIGARLSLFCAVCSAVHSAHQNLVVHRDLKPGNILVTQDGQPKLLDFGIAKILNPEFALVVGDPTRPEFRVMTPEYASPEQVRGTPLSTASDVYSLGVILYELVCGHRPYQLRSRIREELERIICESEPERPSTAISRVEEFRDTPTTTKSITPQSVSKSRESRPDRLRRRLAGDIDNIVLMAMRKEPHRRYASAEQLEADIRRHLDGMPVIARRDTLGYRAAKFIRRNRASVAAAAIIVLLLAGGLIGTTYGMRRAEAEGARADRRFGEARELARLFMFDFDDRLRILAGSIPARKLLVESALDYLAGVSKEVGDDVDLGRELAGAYQRVGDIQGGSRSEHLGDFLGALASYEEARAILAGLVADHPGRADLKVELATCELRIGDALKKLKRADEALRHYENGLATIEALAAAAPADADLQRRLAIMLREVAETYQAMDRVDEAVPLKDRSLAIRKQLARANPNDDRAQRELSGGYYSLAGLLRKEGQRPEALERLDESVAIRRRLADANPDNARYARDLVVGLRFRSTVLLELGRADEAITGLTEAVTTVEKLRALDSASAGLENEESVRLAATHARVLETLGDVHAERRELDLALRTYERYRAEAEALVRISRSYEHFLAAAHMRLGASAGQREEFNVAIVHDEMAERLFADLSEAESAPMNMRILHVFVLCQLADHLRADGQLPKAEARLADARQIVDEHEIGSFRPMVLHGFSATRAAAGAGEEAMAYAEEAIALADEPTPVMLRDKAVAHDLLGQTEEAIALSARALALLEGSKTREDEDLRAALEADMVRYRAE